MTRQSIAFACRLFYREASTIYYAQNEFVVGYFYATQLYDFSRAIGPSNSALVRSITIDGFSAEIRDGSPPVDMLPNIANITLIVNFTEEVFCHETDSGGHEPALIFFEWLGGACCCCWTKLRSLSVSRKPFTGWGENFWKNYRCRSCVRDFQKLMVDIDKCLTWRSRGGKVDWDEMCVIGGDVKEVEDIPGDDGVANDWNC